MTDYFPLEEGLTLEYRTKNAGGEGRMSIEVLCVRREGSNIKARCRRTTKWGDEKRTTEYDVLKDPTGVYAGPEPEFPLPASLGRKWSRYPNDYELAALDAVTTVPAGTFRDCLKVSYLIGGGDAGSGERYYAPSVGFVREVCTDESDPYEYVLLGIFHMRRNGTIGR
jgi:hypothetical protein